LADRDRIARNLHGHVIQRLFAIGLAMQGTHRRAKSPAVAARLAEHLDQPHNVIQDIRTAIFDFQAGSAEPLGLRTTLHEAITELTVDASRRTTRCGADPPRRARRGCRPGEAVSHTVRQAPAHPPGWAGKVGQPRSPGRKGSTGWYGVIRIRACAVWQPSG